MKNKIQEKGVTLWGALILVMMLYVLVNNFLFVPLAEDQVRNNFQVALNRCVVK